MGPSLSWKFDLKTTLANIFGNIQIPGTCNADYYDESVVTGYTTTGQAIMSVLNLAHKTCDNVDTIKVQNILWTTKKAQIAYNCSKNLNNNLMSQSSIDQIDKNPTTYLGTEAQYSTNNCGMGSGAREMSMGSHQAYTGGCGDNASNAKTLIEAVSKSDITRTIGRGCNFYSSDEIKKLGLDCPTNSSL